MHVYKLNIVVAAAAAATESIVHAAISPIYAT